MKRIFHYLTLALVIGSLAMFIGCSKDDNNPTGPSGPTMQNQMSDVGDDYLTGGTKNITAEALFADITNSVPLFIIDFRSSAHYDTCGHIENAHNWTIGNLPDNLSQIPAGAKVVCVCYTGQTASWATSFLRMKGYDAYNLKFGMCGWTADTDVNLNKWGSLTPNMQTLETDNHPLVTEYDYPTLTLSASDVEGSITESCNAQFDAGLKYISANDVYANINDGNADNDVFLLCYWTEAPYNLGHIPGSYRFEPGSLGFEENLKYLPPNKQIVVYCYTGQTSAQVCTYLRMLGYDAWSMLYGMNSVTDRDDLLGSTKYHAPTTDYPVVYTN